MSTRRKLKTTTETKGTITLSGSTKMVAEFFQYSINSILYQRGIYPPEDFKMVKKYGLTLLTTADETLEVYIAKVMNQVQAWLLAGNLSRLVMVITSKETRETLERWQFDIKVEDQINSTTPSVPILPVELTGSSAVGGGGIGGGGEKENQSTSQPPKAKPEKSSAQIQKDIQDIIRQITSSVTFLPSMEEKCSFNILVYTDLETQVPAEWLDSDPHLILGKAEQVKLRSFSTNIHKVEALVAYRLGNEL